MLVLLRQILSRLRSGGRSRPTIPYLLQVQEDQLSALEASLVSSIPDFLLLMTREGRYRVLNTGEGVKLLNQDKTLSGLDKIQDILPPAIAQERLQYVEQALQTGQIQQYEYAIEVEGEIRYEEARISVCGPETVLVTVRDITEKKQAELLLHLRAKQEMILNRISQQIRQSLQLEDVLNTAVVEIRNWLDVDRMLIYRFNPEGSGEVIVESASQPDLSILGKTIHDPCFNKGEIEPYRQGRVSSHEDILSSDLQACHVELLRRFQVRANLVVPILYEEDVWGLLIAHHCTQPRPWQPWEIELLCQIASQLSIAIQQSQLYERTLQQAKRERLLNYLMDSIRKSLDLNFVLNRATELTLQAFQSSRSIVALCAPGDPVFHYTATAAVEGFSPSQGQQIPIQGNRHAQVILSQVTPVSVDDIYQDPLLSDVIPLAESLQIKSMLSVSIRLEEEVKGILSIHQCDSQRRWTWDEQVLLKQVADQLAIALQQAELYQQVQRINLELDQLVQTRTAQLRQALHNEELLRLITQNIREGLDESRSLYVAAQSLGESLGLSRVAIRNIDIEHKTSTLVCDYGLGSSENHSSYQRSSHSESIADLMPLIEQLMQGQIVQCCFLSGPLWPQEREHTLLICPISDGQGLLGTLGASKPSPELFTEDEIQLVQQVAAQCAIAIRQARLYEAAQSQVKELETLNRLKDDFVATVSHELRTPMTNIKMAAKMLKLAVGSPEKRDNYLSLLERECDREITLINDLLDMQYIETGSKILSPEPLVLLEWLKALIDSFRDRINQRQQSLIVELDPDLGTLYSDRLTLERILVELLTNACKYTPPHQQIIVKARPAELIYSNRGRIEGVEFQITNTGVEIPAEYLPQLFQKFYRIPQADRWQQGGTGLGLSLVQRAVNWLGGEISVGSDSTQTTFTVRLPVVVTSSPTLNP